MATVGLPTYEDVNAAYQQHLGRGASQSEYQQYWAQRPDYQQGIATSGEAQAYKQKAQPQGGPPGDRPWMPNEPPPYQAPAPAATPAPTNGGGLDFNTINALYQQYLGRQAGPDEAQGWITGAFGPAELGSIQQQIAASGEAQAYRQAHGGAAPTSGGGGGADWITQALQSVQSTDDPGYWQRVISADPKAMAGDPSAIAYWQDRIRRGDGSMLVKTGQLSKFNDSGGSGQAGGYTGTPYAGTNVFSDPATAQFEQLLNGLITRFQTPQTPPHYQQTIDQLNNYLTQLNGPVYTPAQMELLQTQSLDPLQQQHDAAKEQLIQRLGSRGISPGSGIAEKAMEDLDRQFQQARTQTQAGFATNAVGLQRQNQATAASLAPQISALEQAQTGWQDQRSLQAETLAALIPQMAQQRLTAANQSISPINASSLLQLQNQFQQQGYGQGANYGSAIMQLLAQLFGMQG